ncbi:MAG: altronate dehydratase family protein [Chloroflexales bacterium]
MQISLHERPAIVLHPDDDVAVALLPLSAGRSLTLERHRLRLIDAIAPGHKLALRDVAAGQPVRRYGQVIGFAKTPIAAGQHVHSHNLAVGEKALEYAIGAETRRVPVLSPDARRSFMGYRRPHGRAGTRNTVAVIGTVNCAAHTVRKIAERSRAELLPHFPNVTDVVALAHKSGCATRDGSPELGLLQRTLAGFARNPNVAACLFVGLGCEVNQFAALLESQREILGSAALYLSIQDSGGVAATVEAGLRAVAELLPLADAARRRPVPLSELCLALQCGGSDGFSGITANPALGHAVDLLVAQGGTAVLSETPEIYGAEHLLTRRAVSQAVGEKLVARIRWWEEYTAREGFEIDNNPAPGNKAGGLTTIFEKSLGAVAKAGNMPLSAVYEYAEPISEHGLTFMDTPGYDPVSATGQVAGGCTLIAFTTGRGSCFGFKPAPSIKIATTSDLFRRMPHDMDIDAGGILAGASVESVGRAIFELLIAVASGEPSLSEAQGIGEEEFNPWILGATM